MNRAVVEPAARRCLLLLLLGRKPIQPLLHILQLRLEAINQLRCRRLMAVFVHRLQNNCRHLFRGSQIGCGQIRVIRIPCVGRFRNPHFYERKFRRRCEGITICNGSRKGRVGLIRDGMARDPDGPRPRRDL